MDAATTGGPGDEQLGGAPDDDREVGRDYARGAKARDRAERRCQDGDDRVVLDDEVEAGQRRHVGEPHLLQRLHAAPTAGAVDEPDQWQAEVVRHPLGVDRLLPDGCVGGPAADREVVALEHRPASVDPALADHDVGGQEVGQLAVGVVGPLSREDAGLVKGVRVEEELDPLADGEPAR
jgi:hypothetical protein